jgi:outer membrane protein assembly factor BamE (lipoprotein component of BamABCDE complex)
MTRSSWQRSTTALLFGFMAYFVSPGLVAANRLATRSLEVAVPASKDDKSQWRKLQRGMSKDDVKKLLGEPGKVSVSKYYEFWYYAGGSATFDSKGRLDSWNEP